MGLEGFLDPATSSWLQFSWEAIWLASSQGPDSSTELLSSSQRQLKACSAVISDMFVFAQVLVSRDDVAESVSNKNAQFM
jgi:hypothetical protein